MFGAVGHDNLTGAINAPKTAGQPGGLVLDARRLSPRRLPHRRRPSSRVVVAGPRRRRPWRPDRRRRKRSRRRAIRGPITIPVRSTNIVVFRGTDGHIRSLYWGPDGAVGQDDLSGFGRNADGGGRPVRLVHARRRYPPHRLSRRERPSPRVVLAQCRTRERPRPDGAVGRAARRRQRLGRLQPGRQHPARHLPLERRQAARTVALPRRDGRPSCRPDRRLRRARPPPTGRFTTSSARAPNQHVAYRGTERAHLRAALVRWSNTARLNTGCELIAIECPVLVGATAVRVELRPSISRRVRPGATGRINPLITMTVICTQSSGSRSERRRATRPEATVLSSNAL